MTDGGASGEDRGGWSTGTRWAVGLHGALVLVTAASTLLPGGAPWFLTTPANLLVPLSLLAFALVPLCLWGRRWKLGLLQATAAFVAPLLLASHLRPGRDSAPSDGFDLAVTSLNLGVGLAEPEDVVELLDASDRASDLVLLLELTSGVAADLRRELADRYPHQSLHPGGVDGKGVFSKYPILHEELFTLEQGRPYLRCTLDVRGVEVEVVLVHLAPSVGLLGSGSAAGRDLARILDDLDCDRALVAGDFNSTWWSGVSADLRLRGFREAFAWAGNGLGTTFPVFGRYFGLPIGRFLRVDQVWCGPELAPTWAWTGPDAGSDHLPTGARLVLLP